MSPLAVQMSTNDPAFWVLVVVAVSFVVIAAAAVSIALVAARVARAVAGVERRVEPLIERVTALTEQVRQIASEGRAVAEQVGLMSNHLSTATLHFSESASLVRDEVRELRQLVGLSAEAARDKVEMISRSVDDTHRQLVATADFVTARIVSPAREVAAVMAGIRRGLEVFLAPAPKQIDQTYAEDELFIG